MQIKKKKKWAGAAVTLQACILDVLCLTFGQATSYPILTAVFTIVFKPPDKFRDSSVGHNRFFPNPSQFIIHLPS
jgi:hypothetical protein